MAKRNKQQGKSPARREEANDSALATRQCRPPKKQPVLLTLSVIVFALWFVFLLVTALRG